MSNTLRPDSVDAVRQIVRESASVLPVGAGTKPTLSIAGPAIQRIDMRQIAGIVDYEPSEFTITAMAGTAINQVQQTLAQHGQYLPFDPPLVDRGATVGGTIAAGISGPCRVRYGGVRDFVLGVRFVDGLATLVTGGGKVVKNAAGFDFPKLMVGSCGRLGVLTEVTLKVLPRPAAYCTVVFDSAGLDQAITLQNRLSGTSLPIDAVDLQPPGVLWVRLGGRPTAIRRSAQRAIDIAGCPATLLNADDPAEPAIWRPLIDWTWPGDDSLLVRVAVSPHQVTALDAELRAVDVQRRYSVAGNVAWIAWPTGRLVAELNTMLKQHRLAGTVLRGPCPATWIGERKSAGFLQRIRRALDPEERFIDWQRFQQPVEG